MSEEKKEHSETHSHKKKSSVMRQVRDNPWVVSSVVLAILVLIMLVSGFSGCTGKAISENKAADNLLEFLNEQTGGGVSYVSSEDDGLLYQVTVSYNGRDIPVYVTKDGKYYVQGVTELTSSEDSDSSSSSTGVTKSDKPVVELFVMSYCPYGTQAEKGIIPVAELLGDKIDFRIRFVDYLMHGEKEAEENLREYCIQEIAPEKYLDYMYCFLEGDGDDSSGYIKNGNDVNACLAEAGIDTSALETCIAETDEEYEITEALNSGASYPAFGVDADLNDEYGVSGSPTLVVNGKVVSSARDSASYLEVICSAFNDAPEICETAEVSSDAPSVYFGWDGTGGTSAGSCS